MLVILAIAAIAILACVVLVSLGRGGELAEFPPDVPPLELPEAGRLDAADIVALQLPVNLVGYHTQSVDETLRRAAGAISVRDTRIAVLEQRVSELLSSRLHARQESYAAPGFGPRTEHTPEAPAEPRELPESGDPVSASGASVSWDGGGTELTHLPEEPEWRVLRPAGTALNGKADTDDQAASETAEEAPKPDTEPETEPETKAGTEPDTEAATDDEGRPVRASTAKDGDDRP